MTAKEIERCIDEFGTDIYRFCQKLCVDKSDAEDLYQQTFLKALETEWTLDWEKNPKALFFSLAHNLWKSDRRKQARRSQIAPCDNLDDDAEIVLRSGENIEERYFQKELIEKVRQIIQTLPEKFQVPLLLSFRLFHRADSDCHKKAAWYCEKSIVQGKKHDQEKIGGRWL